MIDSNIDSSSLGNVFPMNPNDTYNYNYWPHINGPTIHLILNTMCVCICACHLEHVIIWSIALIFLRTSLSGHTHLKWYIWSIHVHILRFHCCCKWVVRLCVWICYIEFNAFVKWIHYILKCCAYKITDVRASTC